jgi:coenzyme Q-binding protein COQ10
MPRFSNRRRVAHRADEMFALVADVERYPEFVPLCKALKIRQRRQNADGTETIVADMTVSFKLVKETFTSEVTLDRPGRQINVRYLRGPFSSLENRWSFEPKGENKGDEACDVGFFIAYEFKSRLLALLMGTMFDAAFAKFSTAFEKRADVVYGKKAL